MAALARVRCVWSGATLVGPGLSTFYFAGAHSGFTADLSDFFQAIDNYFPIGTTVTVPSSGDLIEDSTGELTGTWSDPATGPGTGGGAGAFTQGVGVRVRWGTAGVVAGRRVRGATFLAPMDHDVFSADGTPDPTVRTVISTAASALVTASGSNMKVWSRPAPGRGGSSHTVVAADMPDTPSWLRSRRT